MGGEDAALDCSAHAASRPLPAGVEAVEGEAEHAGFGGIPATATCFRHRLAPRHLADSGRRDADIGNGVDRLAVRPDQPIIDREQLQPVRLRAEPDRGAELGIGRADHEALRILRVEIVDRGQHPVAIFGTDADQFKALVAGRHAGETPFVLEPLFLGLLDEEADANPATGPRASGKRRGGAERGRTCQKPPP